MLVIDSAKPTSFPARGAIDALAHWMQEDGPPTAYTEYYWPPHTNGVNHLYRESYRTWDGLRLIDPSDTYWSGAPRVLLFSDETDAIQTFVSGVDVFAQENGLSPQTHKILWRVRPEFERGKIGMRFRLYCRMAFVPIDAQILVPEEDAA